MSVLVVSWDRVGERMAGSAIRALELAAALERHGVAVRLAVPEGSEAPAGAPPLEIYRRGDSLVGPIRRSAAVVVPGRIELLAAVSRPLAVDLYDPFLLSNLDFFGADFARSAGRPLLALRWLQHHLANGDFFLCASSVQRSFWLGMLAAAGRLNRANYEDDPELSRLLAIVPFGVPDKLPRPGPARVKGVLPGIEAGHRLVLWAGGMWNWVDPLTLVRAAHLLRDRRPEVRTLLLGARHPNPEIGEMEAARASRNLARELGLEGSRVFFLDWVPYEERHLYVLESDVGVSLHRSGVESEFAFRTRVLDYLWCARPMVLSRGDDLAARVERDDLGRVVPAESAESVARAIEELLDDPRPEERRARLEAARAELAWSRVVEPLVEFCRAPRFAPDRDGRAFVAAPARREDLPRKEQVLVTEEFVGAARAISPPLGADGHVARQRFRARYPRLCQIDVLFWVEPPVEGEKVVFELLALEEERPRRIARTAVAATQLPAVDWQRFEFPPQEDSQGREYELRLRLERPAELSGRGGRVCLWHTVPPEGPAGEGDGIAFMARYLLDGVVRHLPVAEQSFLFAHNTTVPLAEAAESAGALSSEVALASGAPAADADGLRAELARLGAALAGLGLRARELERRLAALSRAAEERPHADGSPLPHLRGLVRDLLAVGRRAVAAGRRLGLVLLGAVLTTAAFPLALLGAVGLAVVAGLAALSGKRDQPDLPDGPAPSPDGPVSVVVPTWNGLRLLEESLPALARALAAHGHPDDEILIVDNGSDDGTVEWVAERARDVPGLRCIALEGNHGFAGAANRGVAEARSGAVVLLNNDMVVEPDFLQPLLDAFGKEHDLFGVSCQIDFVDPEKPRWETGKVHGEMRWGQLHLFHLDRFDPGLRYPILFAGGGASAYDRRRLLALGGFDERVFRPVYIEDVDLGFRAWQRGWPSVLAPGSRVHHHHRSTTRRLWSEARIESFFRKNLVALVWKDVRSPRLLARHLTGLVVLPLRVLRSHGGRAAVATVLGLWGQVPRLLAARLREARTKPRLGDEEVLSLSRWRFLYRARFHPEDREPTSGRPQALVISPYSPMPALHGGAVRMWNLIREVSSGVDVTLLSLVDTPAEVAEESLARLREVCRDAELVPRDLGASGGPLEPEKTRGFHSARLHALVEDWLERRRFDVVQVEYTHMAHYLPPPCPGLRRALVEHDVSYVARGRARERERSVVRRLRDWLDEQKAFRHEVRAIDRADLAIAMSEEDRRELARWVDPAKLRVVPNGVSCRDFPFAPGEAEPATVLFVGFFRHPPNVEGVLWFARRVLPELRRRVPDVRFRVVGAYPPPAVLALHDPEAGVDVIGEVPETASHYRSAAVFVAPILQGSGTRLKILEAMASGSGVVSTTLGAEGLGAPPDAIRIADAPDAFAAAVAGLLERPAERLDMARRARAFVESRFDWGAIAQLQLAAWGMAPGREDGGPGEPR